MSAARDAEVGPDGMAIGDAIIAPRAAKRENLAWNLGAALKEERHRPEACARGRRVHNATCRPKRGTILSTEGSCFVWVQLGCSLPAWVARCHQLRGAAATFRDS